LELLGPELEKLRGPDFDLLSTDLITSMTQVLNGSKKIGAAAV